MTCLADTKKITAIVEEIGEGFGRETSSTARRPSSSTASGWKSRRLDAVEPILRAAGAR